MNVSLHDWTNRLQKIFKAVETSPHMDKSYNAHALLTLLERVNWDKKSAIRYFEKLSECKRALVNHASKTLQAADWYVDDPGDLEVLATRAFEGSDAERVASIDPLSLYDEKRTLRMTLARTKLEEWIRIMKASGTSNSADVLTALGLAEEWHLNPLEILKRAIRTERNGAKTTGASIVDAAEELHLASMDSVPLEELMKDVDLEYLEARAKLPPQTQKRKRRPQS